MNVARKVTTDIVTNNRGLRYGLITFNAPAGRDSGPGGSLRREVLDFSRSVGPSGAELVSQTQAQNNFDAFKTTVAGVTATSNTPLAETYYEATRYFRGLSRFQGITTVGVENNLYKSPIQYRCQANFGVVVTDGLPTFDQTFPTNDPQTTARTGAGSLPNWDGVNNDGTGGDGEGGTLYLDDIAKFAYDIDLRNTTDKDLAGKSFNAAPFQKQNMKTYTVGFATANQMLSDAARYGQGRYFTANNADQLNASLSQAINEIAATAGSGGAGASSSATLTTSTFYYKTLYDPKDWRGTIEAYKLDPKTGRAAAAPIWTTDTTITPAKNGAKYQTYKSGTGASIVSLSYNNLSAPQKAQIDATVTSPLNGASLIEWLKGTNATGLRNRTVLLGDIVNSTLERAAPEDKTASGDSTYTAYLETKKSSMTSSLLVNGNDGLFHVINANNGSHRYGYMPSALLSSLSIVAKENYATSGSHRFMVDGQITVGDAQLNNKWSTVAVSGMGAGGKSMFGVKLFGADGGDTVEALWEISPPATNTPANKLNDLGYTYSKPLIARNKENEWVAVFGNGYGSYDGKAVLYVVKLSDGSVLSNVVVDANDKGTAAERASGNGLSSPQAVVNAQGQIEKIYAGDLRGNMWEFNGAAFTASKLFEAGAGHPISAQPLIVDHEEGGHLVLFGTGKFNEVADKVDKTQQAFYAIWDPSNSVGAIQKSELLAQSITKEITENNETYIETSETPVDWSAHKGWYLPLQYGNTQQGERVIYPALTTLGRVVFVTAKVDANDPCESNGSGRLVELDLFSGSMLNYAVLDTNGDGKVDDKDKRVSGVNLDGGLPGLPVIIDQGDEKTTQTKIILLSSGAVKTLDEAGRRSSVSGRIMWRQLQ
ncbi:type IV pilus assembly protein PilY1 [Pseudomonas flavescens]|uniref:Type IV pilus assembly protein PilY1 n=2 Tax=Phytopseudomonas flavescens TaxID=29435 RepID=A0A1G8FXF3_9GAMM|nr:type IV pilus assembly protein PilY1 [Pseudomonas flavescens]